MLGAVLHAPGVGVLYILFADGLAVEGHVMQAGLQVTDLLQ